MEKSKFIIKNKIKIVKRPWGEEQWFAFTNDYIGKIFFVKKNYRLSLAYHLMKDETIYLLKGKAKLELEDEKAQIQDIYLDEGESVRIKNGRRHRFNALDDCKVLEVSTPEADDIIRVADDYGRENILSVNENNVCCVGGACMNLLLSTLNEVPRFGTGTTIDEIVLRSAGESLNVAYPLARLKIPVSIITYITDDAYGKMIYKDILKYSINSTGLQLIKNDKTGITICLINKSGDRILIDYPGLKSKMNKNTIYENFHVIEKSKYIYFGGYFNHPRIGFKEYRDILNKVKKMKKIVLLDTCWDPKNFDKKTIKELLEILSYVDIFLPNYEEGKAISKKENPSDIIEFFEKQGIQSLFLKLGPKGSAAFYKNEVKFQNAFDVKVKDTVGAGDAFNAGVIYGFIKNYNLEKILKISTAISNIVITKDKERYPDLKELSVFLRKHPE
ncbi:MAG: PfkB family carbohydrate kinase [Actinobacteria bacterium]|nr:PfkB family carbohydrate kinase [Actinomycetota bacterium]